jgi:hypothetical protein
MLNLPATGAAMPAPVAVSVTWTLPGVVVGLKNASFEPGTDAIF